MALKSDRNLGNSTAEVPVKFQSDTIIKTISARPLHQYEEGMSCTESIVSETISSVKHMKKVNMSCHNL